MFVEIDQDALIEALQDELALSGGVFGIRDQGLLDCALARPAQILEPFRLTSNRKTSATPW